jgi:low temperature requirement protein LtrA
MKFTNSNIWWGPPKKFSTTFEERKISWLELFYDLVYVIAISKTTHLLASHPDFNGLLDYFYIFGLIFWGWLNGSSYHDLHGSEGIRNRLITFWQMTILAALVVTTFGNQEFMLYRATICLLIMQIYITYLWWSVGIYDKEHRKLALPYIICYLISFGLIFSTLFLEQSWLRIIFYFSLFFNYLPPFLYKRKYNSVIEQLSISSSMTERLGLFTIILFGEAVLGIISGIMDLEKVSFEIWLHFSLSLIIVFALWWIFFAIIADREAKKGLRNGSTIQILYAFTLMAFGIFAASFSKIFVDFPIQNNEHSTWIKYLFGISLGAFLLGITLISRRLIYPKTFQNESAKFRTLTYFSIFIIFMLTFFNAFFSLTLYLAFFLFILLLLVIYISRVWFLIELNGRKIADEI